MNNNNLLFGLLLGGLTTNNLIIYAGSNYLKSYNDKENNTIEYKFTDDNINRHIDNNNSLVDENVDPTTDESVDPTTDESVDPTTDESVDPTTDESVDPTTDESVDPTTDESIDPTTDDQITDDSEIGMSNESENDIDTGNGIDMKYIYANPYQDIHILNNLIIDKGYLVINNFMESMIREIRKLFDVRGSYQKDNIKFIDDMIRINIQKIINRIKLIIYMDENTLIDYCVCIDTHKYILMNKMINYSDYEYTILINWNERKDIFIDNHIYTNCRISIINNRMNINHMKDNQMMVIKLRRADDPI